MVSLSFWNKETSDHRPLFIILALVRACYCSSWWVLARHRAFATVFPRLCHLNHFKWLKKLFPTVTRDMAEVQCKSLFKRNPQNFVSISARRIVGNTRGMDHIFKKLPMKLQVWSNKPLVATCPNKENISIFFFKSGTEGKENITLFFVFYLQNSHSGTWRKSVDYKTSRECSFI